MKETHKTHSHQTKSLVIYSKDTHPMCTTTTMISNHCTYNTLPLAVVADMLCEGALLVRPTRKRSLNAFHSVKCSSSSYMQSEHCEAPASKKRRLPVKKSVRFAEESNEVVFIMASREDLHSAWYHPAEIAAFKQDSKRSVYELYQANGDLSKVSKDHCIRGLEHVVTPRAAMAQKRARKERVSAVLIQQLLQRETSTSNPELLKLISRLISQPRCEEAAHRGAMDATIWAQYF